MDLGHLVAIVCGGARGRRPCTSSMNRCLSQRLHVGRLWSHQLLDQGAAPNRQRRCVDDGQISSSTVKNSA